MKLGGTLWGLANTIRVHPAVGDSVMEAVEKLLSGAIHCLQYQI